MRSVGQATMSVAEWRLRARCRGASADTFYPPDKERVRARLRREAKAKAICLACPVLAQCRRQAVESREPHGIWGATTPKDRERLLLEVEPVADAVSG